MTEQDPVAEGSTSLSDAAPTTPMLRVISGNPSAEEVAALVAVVSALGSVETGAGEPLATGQWATPTRLHRAAVHPGPSGSWWASGLPR